MGEKCMAVTSVAPYRDNY